MPVPAQSFPLRAFYEKGCEENSSLAFSRLLFPLACCGSWRGVNSSRLYFHKRNWFQFGPDTVSTANRFLVTLAVKLFSLLKSDDLAGRTGRKESQVLKGHRSALVQVCARNSDCEEWLRLKKAGSKFRQFKERHSRRGIVVYEVRASSQQNYGEPTRAAPGAD